jgi:ATP-dependent RNA helicase DDX19/DBP5
MEKLEESKTNATVNEVELVKNEYTKNIANPCINQKKDWDNEDDFTIPKDIVKNIQDNLKFVKPSNI